TPSANRYSRNIFFQPSFWNGSDHIRGNLARCYGIDSDAFSRAVLRQCLGTTMDRGFARGIVVLSVLTRLTVNGTYIDDTAEFPFPHTFNNVAAHVEAGAEDGVQQRLPVLWSHFMNGAVARDTCIIHQNVNWPHVGNYFT